MAEEPKEKPPAEVEETPVEHEPKAENKEPTKASSKWQRFLTWYKTDKKRSVPITIVLLLILLAVWPFSRYHAAGLVLKKDFTLQVNDSTAGTPVSGADVALGAGHAVTDAKGKANFKHIAVGQYTAVITKKYYDDRRVSMVVPIMRQKTTPQIAFAARGRQVKVVLSNAINGDKLGAADIHVAGTTAKTDELGSATFVVPTGVNSAKAKLRAAGYNDAEVTVEVSNREIRENDFKMTPAGKIYFLSKLSGKIDVVKTNLDGSDRQTVLAGTGKEDDRGTVLLAARDWKYLALLSRRETSSPKLYLLDTSNDSMMPMDTANATFTPVGWSGSNFVYTATRDDVQLWQPNHQALKSYNAVTKKTATLDQTKGEGTNNFDYQSEAYGQVYQFDKYIVYSKSWNYGYSADSTTLAHKNSGIYSIWSNGTNPQTLKSFPLSSGGVYIYSVPSHANQAIYQVYAPGSGSPSYFTYQSGRVVQAPSNAADEFNDYQQNPITYLQSPSGDNTFWAESRDGKYALFIGGQNADNAKQIATLSEYLTYGWYTDDYLLVSKNSSELYAMPRDGTKNDTSALKISDYHKPAQNFFGYGGGYGGI